MQKEGSSPLALALTIHPAAFRGSLAAMLLLAVCLIAPRSTSFAQAVAQPTAQSVGTPLLQPTSVAYDTTGNLYFAESRKNVIQRMDPTGTLTLVAGTRVQGFSGDGGPATSAELDSPRGVAIDSAGTIYIADTRNQRIRVISATTGQITTLAGTGKPGFSGDGSAAASARLFLPTALALDGAGHLFVADTGNQRIRSIDLASLTIQTVAGSGRQGFTGDGGPALAAALSNPSGLASDAFGNLFIADSANARIREVSATSHLITTLAGAGSFGVSFVRPEGLSLSAAGNLLIADSGSNRVYLLNLSNGSVRVVAGTGTQAYSGDQGVASLAMLDFPSSAAFAPSGGLVIADSGNLRIRQVASLDPGATISTLIGAAARAVTSIALSGAPSQTYGAVALTASSGASLPQASISLADVSSPTPLALAALTAGSAAFSLPALSAGTHTLVATFPGDATHLPSQSAPFAVTVLPRPISVSPPAISILYGQPLPSLQVTPTGTLPQDASQLSLVLTPQLPAILTAGTYPVAVALSGPAAGNYALSGAPTGTLTIARAPSAVTLSQIAGNLTLAVTSTTSGTPTGAVRLLTSSGAQLASAPLTSTGTASLLTTGLSAGTYTVTAVYSGDANFLAGQSTSLALTIPPSSAPPTGTPDFNLNASGPTSQTIHAGESATFTFALTSTGASLAGPVVLSTAGSPALATATLDPTVVSPGSSSSVIHLTITTPRAAALDRSPLLPAAPLALAAFLPAIVVTRRRRLSLGPLVLLLVSLAAPFALTGCGDRVASTAAAQQPTATPYTVTVTGLTTTSTGATLQHTATVTLSVL